MLPEAGDQGDEGDLRGIRFAGKHAFAEKGPGQRDAVEPTLKTVRIPALDRVGVTEVME